jgi:hypothetical protein
MLGWTIAKWIPGSIAAETNTGVVKGVETGMRPDEFGDLRREGDSFEEWNYMIAMPYRLEAETPCHPNTGTPKIRNS